MDFQQLFVVLLKKIALFQNEIHTMLLYVSSVMRKSAFCICENKGADQLCVYRTADQPLCLHYIDSTIPLLPKLAIPIAVQPSLCLTWAETRRQVFSRHDSLNISESPSTYCFQEVENLQLELLNSLRVELNHNHPKDNYLFPRLLVLIPQLVQVNEEFRKNLMDRLFDPTEKLSQTHELIIEIFDLR